jgi:hypothetical protein
VATSLNTLDGELEVRIRSRLKQTLGVAHAVTEKLFTDMIRKRTRNFSAEQWNRFVIELKVEPVHGVPSTAQIEERVLAYRKHFFRRFPDIETAIKRNGVERQEAIKSGRLRLAPVPA